VGFDRVALVCPWSVRSPMVIGGSKRHALENPGSRKPSAEPVSKIGRASHDYDEARGSEAAQLRII